MDREKKLREQLAAAYLRPEVILHEVRCPMNPCACDVRAIVAVRVRANNRQGYRVSRHVVRVNPNAPEPQPWTPPEPEPELPPVPKAKHETIITVQPVNGTPPEPPKKRRRGRPRKQR